MKKIIFPALLVFGISLFSSCAKKNDAPTNTTPTSSFSASVSGKAWSATSFTATTNSVATIIKGTAADGSYMQLDLPATVKVGVDSLSTSSTGYAFQYNNTVTDYTTKSGTIKFTSYSNKVLIGTFTVTIEDPSNPSLLKFISNGSFTAIFQ